MLKSFYSTTQVNKLEGFLKSPLKFKVPKLKFVNIKRTKIWKSEYWLRWFPDKRKFCFSFRSDFLFIVSEMTSKCFEEDCQGIKRKFLTERQKKKFFWNAFHLFYILEEEEDDEQEGDAAITNWWPRLKIRSLRL